MRRVHWFMFALVLAAITALLVDASVVFARPGGGPSRGGPGVGRGGLPGPGGGATSGRYAPSTRAGAGSQMGGMQHGSQYSTRQRELSNWQQQAAEQLRNQAIQQRQHQTQRSNWQNRGNVQRNVQAWWNEHQNGPQPFTPAWYAQHPQAWHATHPYAKWWAAAAVIDWLGWAAAPSYSSTTVVYDMPPEEAEEMNALATVQEEWLPLGVYSLVTAPDQPPMQMVQLAVDRQGALRGVHYDAVTNSTHAIVGTLDRNTHMAQWSLETNPNMTFQAGLDQLTRSQGIVEVSLPGGVQQWQLVRMESPGR